MGGRGEAGVGLMKWSGFISEGGGQGVLGFSLPPPPPLKLCRLTLPPIEQNPEIYTGRGEHLPGS